MATKRDDDELRAMLRAVPQRIVGEMCGRRQTVHLQRVADRWGFPIDGKTVDLFAVMSRLWEFLKRYGPMLSAVMDSPLCIRTSRLTAQTSQCLGTAPSHSTPLSL